MYDYVNMHTGVIPSSDATSWSLPHYDIIIRKI